MQYPRPWAELSPSCPQRRSASSSPWVVFLAISASIPHPPANTSRDHLPRRQLVLHPLQDMLIGQSNLRQWHMQWDQKGSPMQQNEVSSFLYSTERLLGLFLFFVLFCFFEPGVLGSRAATVNKADTILFSLNSQSNRGVGLQTS